MTLLQDTRNAVDQMGLPILDIVNDDELFESLLTLITLPASPCEVVDVLRGLEQDVTELERIYNL